MMFSKSIRAYTFAQWQVSSAVTALGSDTLNSIRTYVAAAKQLPYVLSEDMAEQLQDEFIAARREDRTFSPEKFSERLTVSGFLFKGASALHAALGCLNLQ